MQFFIFLAQVNNLICFQLKAFIVIIYRLASAKCQCSTFFSMRKLIVTNYEFYQRFSKHTQTAYQPKHKMANFCCCCCCPLHSIWCCCQLPHIHSDGRPTHMVSSFCYTHSPSQPSHSVNLLALHTRHSYRQSHRHDMTIPNTTRCKSNESNNIMLTVFFSFSFFFLSLCMLRGPAETPETPETRNRFSQHKDYRRSIIIKRQIPNLARRQLFRADFAFANEIQAYRHVVPCLRQFTKNIIPLPVCLYAGADTSGDIIALEDLAPSGHQMANRLKGLDYGHCKRVMQVIYMQSVQIIAYNNVNFRS